MSSQSTPLISDERDDGGDRRLLLPLPEVAVLLDVSLITVRRMVRDGEIPYRLVRGAYRIPRAFIDEFVSADLPGSRNSIAKFAISWTPDSPESAETVA